MTELQKEYCEEKGLIYIKPENTEISDYVNWLERQIQALRINGVVGRSEQLIAKEQDAFDKGYTKGWTEGFNSGKVNGD
jgi:flagellar biosynthesis/type III secretory pathway protein FliH